MKNLLDTEWQENINDINNPVFIETKLEGIDPFLTIAAVFK